MSQLNFFQSSFRFADKLSTKYEEFPYNLFPHVHSLTPQCCICYNQTYANTSLSPKTYSYIKVHSQCVHSVCLNRCIMTCIQQYSSKKNSFIDLNCRCSAYSYFPLPTPTTNLFIIFIVLPFQECLTIVIIQYDLLLSISNMHLSFLHVSLMVCSSYIFSAE